MIKKIIENMYENQLNLYFLTLGYIIGIHNIFIWKLISKNFKGAVETLFVLKIFLFKILVKFSFLYVRIKSSF